MNQDGTSEMRPRTRQADYRDFMSSFPSGVAVVTSTDMRGHPFGFTCSSLCSVTLEPPTLLVCMKNDSGTLTALRWKGAFAVNLLHERGRRAALMLASGLPDRFDHVGWELSGARQLPYLVEDAHSVAECGISGWTTVGDHTVVFGEVGAVTCRPGVPLLYGFRRFAAWTATEPDSGAANEAAQPGREPGERAAGRRLEHWIH